MLKKLYLCEDYLVSDEGYVLGKNGQPLKPSINPHGYSIINISINGVPKGLSVHRAIMMTFCPEGKMNDTYQVNHIDGNKQNNKLSNLEWVTPTENARHSVDVLGNRLGANNVNAKGVIGRHKKTGDIIKFDSMIDGGRYFNPNNPRCGQTTIYKALSGYLKSAYGYTWEYAI